MRTEAKEANEVVELSASQQILPIPVAEKLYF